MEKKNTFAKIALLGKRKSKISKLTKLVNLNPKVIAVTSSRARVIEITNIQATKGLANKFVCEKFNIKPSEAVHVGDTMNDSTAKGVMG
jgi:hydroxymethylpyrimidine pyrophosphatase-like HAD family hydrolase